MPQPASHLYEVTLQIQHWTGQSLDLKLPVWTPGSYLIREYAKHLQDFSATTPAGEPLSWAKLSKNHWQVQTPATSEIKIHYRVFAHDLSVRTNHLDSTHGYFNPAALCFYLPGFEQTPIKIAIAPAETHWRVTTSLPQVPGEPNSFWAADYDTLVDSPFEIGTHSVYDFEVLGKPHQFAIWGEGNFAIARILEDTRKLIETEAALFGGLPYDRYLFLLHLSPRNNGGLEHKFACSLNYSRFGFRAEAPYHRFITLVAHEFFHLWNVKRIRPQALARFDYDRENYTPSLWFCEGTTSYYDQIIPLRAGIYDARNYLKLLSEDMTRLQTTPGRRVQPLSESSFDAWIKLYRPDANSPNAQISYYLKGQLVSLLLDLRIRQRHANQRSLDDVMRRMWQDYGQTEVGFSPEDLRAVLEAVAGEDLTDFYQHYIHGTAELPFNQFLAPFGLELQPAGLAEEPPYLGLTVANDKGNPTIKTVEVDSPAQRAGIEPGDELLAIAGFRVTAEQLNHRLQDYQPGDAIAITVFQGDRLRTCTAQLQAPVPQHYQIQALPDPTPTQAANFLGWLGSPLESLKS